MEPIRLVVEYNPATEDIRVTANCNIGPRFVCRILSDAKASILLKGAEPEGRIYVPNLSGNGEARK